jgi:hypothetical protein
MNTEEAHSYFEEQAVHNARHRRGLVTSPDDPTGREANDPATWIKQHLHPGPCLAHNRIESPTSPPGDDDEDENEAGELPPQKRRKVQRSRGCVPNASAGGSRNIRVGNEFKLLDEFLHSEDYRAFIVSFSSTFFFFSFFSFSVTCFQMC